MNRPPAEYKRLVECIANAVREADVILIATGSGMGVGSGLCTIRGANSATYTPHTAGDDDDDDDAGKGVKTTRLVNGYVRETCTALSYMDLVNPQWFTAPESTERVLNSCNYGYAYWRSL